MLTPTLFYFISLALFVSNAAFCAVVRYFHVCQPFREDAAYYFPARISVTLFYVSSLLLLPSLIRPFADDSLLYARIFGIIYFPLGTSYIYSDYFGEFKTWKREAIGRFVYYMIILTVAIIVLFGKGILVSHQTLVIVIASMLFVYGVIRQGLKVAHIARRYVGSLENSVSSTDEIPVNALYEAILLVVICEFPLLIAFLTKSSTIIGLCYLMMVFVNTGFLLIILNPQRPIKFKTVPIEDHACNAGDELVSEATLALADAIENAMAGQLLFKNPHLTINELAVSVGAHPLDVRAACKVKYRNFYDLVNTYRLEYAKKYESEHPDAKRDNIAFESGFGSYRSYLRTEARMKETQKN